MQNKRCGKNFLYYRERRLYISKYVNSLSFDKVNKEIILKLS